MRHLVYFQVGKSSKQSDVCRPEPWGQDRLLWIIGCQGLVPATEAEGTYRVGAGGDTGGSNPCRLGQGTGDRMRKIPEIPGVRIGKSG